MPNLLDNVNTKYRKSLCLPTRLEEIWLRRVLDGHSLKEQILLLNRFSLKNGCWSDRIRAIESYLKDSGRLFRTSTFIFKRRDQHHEKSAGEPKTPKVGRPRGRPSKRRKAVRR